MSTADLASLSPASERIQREDHEQAAKRELLLRPHVKVPVTTMCDSAEVLRSSKGACRFGADRETLEVGTDPAQRCHICSPAAGS